MGEATCLMDIITQTASYSVVCRVNETEPTVVELGVAKYSVLSLVRTHAHHSSKSGYARLVDYLRKRIPVDVVDGSKVALLPSRMCKFMSRRSAHKWYSPRSFRMEAEAMIHLFKSRNSICHVLYAEDDLRYLGHARFLRRLTGSRLVATYHQPPSVLPTVVDYPRTARKLDAVIALGSNQVPYLTSILGNDRVFLVPHGVDTDYYLPPARKVTDGRVCLFVGNWLRDFEMLREVLACVEAKNPSIIFRLVVLEKRASYFVGLKNVQVMHSLSEGELLKEYQLADMLVLPYVDCAASNTLLEGLACGLPTITTDVGGIRDYVTPECAYTLTPGDVEGMSEAILTLVDDARLREAMGKQSRLSALRFDWSLVAQTHMEVYSSLVA
jgi:glycosyltransferase involved in cell wall biosynthesis